MPVVIDYGDAEPFLLRGSCLRTVFVCMRFMRTLSFRRNRRHLTILKYMSRPSFLRPAGDYKLRFIPRNESDRLGRILAIGQKAAYYTGTDRFVNLIENGGLYMDSRELSLYGKMAEAAKKPLMS